LKRQRGCSRPELQEPSRRQQAAPRGAVCSYTGTARLVFAQSRERPADLCRDGVTPRGRGGGVPPDRPRASRPALPTVSTKSLASGQDSGGKEYDPGQKHLKFVEPQRSDEVPSCESSRVTPFDSASQPYREAPQSLSDTAMKRQQGHTNQSDQRENDDFPHRANIARGTQRTEIPSMVPPRNLLKFRTVTPTDRAVPNPVLYGRRHSNARSSPGYIPPT